MKGIVTIVAEPGRMEQREFEVQAPAPGGVLVRMVRANVCGSEIPILAGRHPLVGVGCVLGHEGVGVIEALGDGVNTDFSGEPLTVGDRVVFTYFQACRRCPECNRGDLNICRNAYQGWSTPAEVAPHFHGTFSTFYAVGPNQYVYKVPENVSDKAASFANCAFSQVMAGNKLGGVKHGQKVVILGAGGLGLCASAIAAEYGAEVFVAELSASRLARASEFGAQHLIDLAGAEGSDGRVELIREATGGADVVIDVTGAPDSFTEGFRALRPGGDFVSIGSVTLGRTTAFDPGLFTRSGSRIHAAIRYAPTTLGESLRFLSSAPQYPWDSLVDADYAFDDIDAAVTAMQNREVTRAALLIGE